MDNSTEWFDSWFDTPYYHSLYANRDDSEAAFFLDNVVNKLALPKEAKMLDAACGKGRHSLYLHEKGFDVRGFDLSKQSIALANEMAEEGLHFDVRDIRFLDYSEAFDLVLNLFTSFGYFDTDKEDQEVVDGFARALKPGGLVLIDYLNPQWVRDTLVATETKVVGDISYNIEREAGPKWVKKHIRFEDKGDKLEFTEQVKLWEQEDFARMFSLAGLEITDTFGNYALEPYTKAESPRQIIVGQKR